MAASRGWSALRNLLNAAIDEEKKRPLALFER
jgi:hypothetical protein